MKKTAGIIENIAAVGTGILGTVSMAWLFSVSFVYTQTFFVEEQGEYLEQFMPRVRDGIKGNVLFIFGAVLLFGLFLWAGRRIKKDIVLKTVLVAACVFPFLLSTVWIHTMHISPWADSGKLIEIAEMFARGDYSEFIQGSYLTAYPQQVGLVMLHHLAFRLGWNPVFTFQTLSSLALPLCTLAGYRLVDSLWENKAVDVIYLLLQMCCLPFFFYTTFVYGEVLSITFQMLALSFAAALLKKGENKRRLAGLILFTGAALFIRKNSLIIVAAMALCGLVTLLRREKRAAAGLLLAGLLAGCVLPALVEKVVYGRYETGADSMPSFCHIAMGMQNGGGLGIGGHNGYNLITFRAAGSDAAAAKELALKDIREQLKRWSANPGEAALFYKEKLLWQWTAPAFQCFVMSRFHTQPPEGLAHEILYGGLRKPVSGFMDSYQSLIYAGMLWYCLMIMRKRKDFAECLPAVVFLGGFLFSALWEAAPRYMLPHYVLMIPAAAWGIYDGINLTTGLGLRGIACVKKLRHKTDIQERHLE